MHVPGPKLTSGMFGYNKKYILYLIYINNNLH